MKRYDNFGKYEVAIRKILPKVCQTYLNNTPYDLQSILHSIRIERFPEIPDSFEVSFVRGSTLAFINKPYRIIYLHDLLNHPQTPLDVFKFIFTHELVHMIVPHENIDGKEVSHPPKFWDLMKERSPEKDGSWVWISLTFMWCVKIDYKKECVFVKKNWKKFMTDDRQPISFFLDMIDKCSHGESIL